VVTGASDGIGRAFARELAQAGLHLVLVARREAALRRLGDELRQDAGVEVRVIAADLGSDGEVDRVVEGTDDLPVGLLVAAAGFGGSGPLIDADLRTELAMLDLNCRAVLRLAHPFGRRFRAQGRGGIVLLSSIVAFQGVPRAANYAATKAYVQSLAEGLAVELAPFGVDVVASAPGPTASGFAARADMKLGNAMSPAVVARESMASLGRRTVVRPGWFTKFLEFGLALLPRSLRVRVLTAVMHGMTKHQLARASS
jgi:hypothetical protein